MVIKVGQGVVVSYVEQALRLPVEGRKQIESMVILHFDMTDEEAKQMVGEALLILLERWRRRKLDLQGQIRWLDRVIGIYENQI